MPEHHVLGISGGKDSSALAVFMRQNYPELDITYFFTDTGKELPEVYEYLGKLEGFLGKPILRLNPERDFDFWLRVYNNFLPSPQTRWCTKQLKLLPFRNWIQPWLDAGDEVYSYVAIRADEEKREGYSSTNEKLYIKLPFREERIDKQGVYEILDAAGLGLPAYYKWRSRSGCTFCFFQRKIEWVNLKKYHPEAFEEAKAYEKNALEHGSPFTWSKGESLLDLEKIERTRDIVEEHLRRVVRAANKTHHNPLFNFLNTMADYDDVYGNSNLDEPCDICNK